MRCIYSNKIDWQVGNEEVLVRMKRVGFGLLLRAIGFRAALYLLFGDQLSRQIPRVN